MSRFIEHSSFIYESTQKDCSDFSERPAVKLAQREICGVVRDLNALTPNAKFLDVGCGAGQFVEMIHREFKVPSYGVTLSREEIRNAEQSNVSLIYSDMHDIACGDKEFDVIYAGHVLEHSVAPTVALREWRRLLKDNGYLLIWGPVGRDFKGFDDGTVVYGCSDHLLTPTEWQYKWLFEITELNLVAEFDIPYQPLNRKARLRRSLKRAVSRVIAAIGLTLLPRFTPGTAALYVLKKANAKHGADTQLVASAAQ